MTLAMLTAVMWSVSDIVAITHKPLRFSYIILQKLFIS